MASNLFKIFDVNKQGMMSASDYNSNTQRLNGVTTGKASSLLHNKLFRQLSVMTSCLGEAMASKGYTMDDMDSDGLTTNLKKIMTDYDMTAQGYAKQSWVQTYVSNLLNVSPRYPTWAEMMAAIENAIPAPTTGGATEAWVRTTINNSLSTYTFEKSVITQKDTDTLRAAKDYTLEAKDIKNRDEAARNGAVSDVTAFFNTNRSTSGETKYQKLPGGLIFAWGRVTGANITNGTTVTIDFSSAGMIVCHSIVLTPENSRSAVAADFDMQLVSITGGSNAIFYVQDVGGIGGYLTGYTWFAIGM